MTWVVLAALALGGGAWWLLRTPPAATTTAPATAPQVAEAASTPPKKGPDVSPDEMGLNLKPLKPAAAGTGAVTLPDHVPAPTLPPSTAQNDAGTAAGTGTAADAGGHVSTTPSVFPDTLELDAVAGRRTDLAAAREKALSDAFKTGDWDGYVALLERSMAAWWKKAGTPRTQDDVNVAFRNPLFYDAFIRHGLLAKFDAPLRRHMTDVTGERDFYLWLFSHPEPAESFLMTVRPKDDVRGAIATWAEIWSEDKTARDRFQELALACALVFEKPASFTWNGQSVTVTAYQRFKWYADKATAGKLVGKIDRMNARQLVWVVGSRVPDSELEWALKEMHLRQKNWGDAYGMVEYDMEKAVKGTNRYDSYTLAEILDKGGICSDRAYFSMHTARAAGLPATDLSGDGPRGGHAWFTWMADDEEWHITGRFDGYGMGSTRHPQTGESLSEQEFVWRSNKRTHSEKGALTAHRNMWLADLWAKTGQADSAGTLLDLAVKAGKYHPIVWQKRLEFWLAKRRESPLAEWRDLVADMKKSFREDTTLMALAKKAEDEVIFPQLDEKTTMAELRKDTRKMDQEVEKGGAVAKPEDIAAGWKRQAEVMAKAKDFEAVRSLYRRAFDSTSDPSVFRILARDLYAMVESDSAVLADACREMETAWRRQIDQGGDYFAIQSQNSALGTVIDCWRKAGNTEKADSLQKLLDRRGKKSTRNAL